MKFDLTDNNLNALEYEVMTHDNAVARVVEAFKLYWSHTEIKHPQYVLQRVCEDLGVHLSFLPLYELKQIESEINSFLHSC